MTQVLHLTKPIDMKFSDSKDVDNKFKFNPRAVPFIPSVEQHSRSTMDPRRVDMGKEYWNPALREPDFHRFADFMQTEGSQSISYPFYSSSKRNVSAERVYDFEPQLTSSWLQEEFFLNESCGGSSVCDESLSTTPVSSASPPLNEDLDRNSISYGSLPLSSFPDPFPSSTSHASSLPVENHKGEGDVMRYYSPFGTGVSTWLADGKATRKEVIEGSEERDGKMPLDVEKEILSFGKVWNDEDSSSREADSPGDAWMRQISVDEDSSLFTRSESKDATDDLIQLPIWEFPNVLDPNPWLEAADKSRRSSSKANWNGIGSTKWDMQTKKALKDAFLPTLIENNLRFCDDRRETKMHSAERNLFASPASGFEYVQRGSGSPSSAQKLPTNGQLRHQGASHYNRSENLEVLPETMYYMPHLVPGMMNPTAVPIIYLPGPHGHQPMLNQFLPHMARYPHFINFDHRSTVPQFYPGAEQMAFFAFGNRHPLLTSVVRHTGPALELHQQLDQCYDQFRHLENERKKVEAEMARQHPGKVVTSDNTRPVPLMPPNPSRIDRLVVEVLREHAKVVTLVSRMEDVRGVRFRKSLLAVFDYWLDGAQKLQTCRKNEIINRKKYRLDNRGLVQKEKDVLALATSLSDLAVSTRRTRTALWCGLQLSSSDLPRQCIRQANIVAKRSSASELGQMCNEVDEEESDNEYGNEFGLDEEYFNECINYAEEQSKDSGRQEFDSEVGDDACFQDELGNVEDQGLYDRTGEKSAYEILTKVADSLRGMVLSRGSDDEDQLDEGQMEQRSNEPHNESNSAKACKAEEGKTSVERSAFFDESEA